MDQRSIFPQLQQRIRDVDEIVRRRQKPATDIQMKGQGESKRKLVPRGSSLVRFSMTLNRCAQGRLFTPVFSPAKKTKPWMMALGEVEHGVESCGFRSQMLKILLRTSSGGW